ncbi:MAG TPA: WGR domain-containing protein [Kofleriaceae bacterium]|nr:WGR domain-containing protein [Kofleriaceae bacterium]
MSEWTVHLEFEEGTSSKFWRARVEGKTLYVNYGKIGSAGQTQVKDFANGDAAQKEYDKLVREKRKKGYVDSGGGGDGGEQDDDEDDDLDDDGGDDDEDEAPPPRKAAPPPPAAPARPAAAASTGRPANALKLTLQAGSRTVETYLYMDGKTVRMDSAETYGTPEAAKKAYERLRKTLSGEGYKEG